MEWKFYWKKGQYQMERKYNGNGMEKKVTALKVKQTYLEWKRKGIGMEKIW